ncbi:oligosaccharide flippase family protein [Gammaproteobacteria bacterium]|nr:oligosaccharide flippase family protein [Gammaproteobacteria bacterium]
MVLRERSFGLILTGLSSYLARLGSGLVILITIPQVRQSLDPELFGVWMMLSSLIVFFGFADLGVGNSVLNYVSESNAKRNYNRLRQAVFSGYVVAATGSVVILAGWSLWRWLATEPTALAGVISVSNRDKVSDAFDLFFLTLAIVSLLGLVQKIRLGMQRGYWNGISMFGCSIVTLVAVPVVLEREMGLTGLVLATLGVQALGHFINTIALIFSNTHIFFSKGGLPFNKVVFFGVLRTGLVFFLMQISVALAFQSDAIVLIQVLGQEPYGDFAVVQKLFFLITSVVLAAIAGLWAAFGDAIATKDFYWVRRALFKASLISLCVAGACVIVLSWQMASLLEVWLGVRLHVPWQLLTVLSLWVVIESVANVMAAFMNAANILKAQVAIGAIMAMIAFLLKWPLVDYLGAYGSTLATLITYLVISVPAQWYLISRQFRIWKDQPTSVISQTCSEG